jgi:hypothetical protein
LPPHGLIRPFLFVTRAFYTFNEGVKLHQLEKNMKCGRILRAGGFAALIALATSTAAFAQGAGSGQAGAPTPSDPTSGQPGKGYHCCNNNPGPLNDNQVANLEGDMNGILQRNPNGGGQLVSTIRDLMLSDSDALPLILNLLSSATSDQKAAIASGLAQAARLWVASTQGPTPPNPPTIGQGVSTAIQQKIASTNDQPFILAYSTAAGNNPIGAAGGGGGGGGSSGGPGGQTSALSNGFFGTGSAEGIGGGGVNTGGFTMTGGVTAGSSTTSTTATSP